MHKYKFVNPKIGEQFDDTVEAESPVEAAKKLWLRLAEFITGSIPQFSFTIEELGKGTLHSFQVEETPHGKITDYNIAEIRLNLTPTQEAKLLSYVENLHVSQKGGKHKRRRYERDDDDGDSSTTEDVYNKFNMFQAINRPQPISYLWYTPSIYNLKKLYVPTFNAPLIPYVEISLTNPFLY